jgi:hypothetical protein
MTVVTVNSFVFWDVIRRGYTASHTAGQYSETLGFTHQRHKCVTSNATFRLWAWDLTLCASVYRIL